MEAFAKENGIKSFVASVTSLRIGDKGSLIPTCAIADVEKNGCKFCTALNFTMDFPNSDCYIAPDMSTLAQMQWKPELAWFTGDIVAEGGKPYANCPRTLLKNQMSELRTLGFNIKTGLEAEFYLVDKDYSDIDTKTATITSYFDLTAMMRQADVLTAITDNIAQLGWKPYQTLHEFSPSQYEINYDYDDALVTADRFAFLKFMTKQVASEHGLAASFMPLYKPGAMSPAIGLHVNLSLWAVGDGSSAMGDAADSLGLSATARHFLAGVMKHMDALTVIGCPQVNSYKRIQSLDKFIRTKTYGEDKMANIRIVKEADGRACNRLEIRFPDGSCNPYFFKAAVIAAGIDGIKNKTELNPEEQFTANIFAGEPMPKDIKYLAETLPEALKALEQSEFMMSTFGQELLGFFIYVKKQQWVEYNAQVTAWEMQQLETY